MGKTNLSYFRRLHGRFHEKRLERAKEKSIRRMVKTGYKQSQSAKNAPKTTEDYPVDFVVLWVDPTDPVWQADKAKYLPQDQAIKKSNSAARFRDWDNFQYWFRTVEKYAPWVRNVYLVTWGHVPSFLDLNCPKLKFVRHDEFIPEAYRPTFSCFPTELNLWRIEGIAEHIVYFNDDMFLTRPVEKSDFFHNGLPKYCAYAKPSYPHMTMTAWSHNLFNNAGVVNDYFDVRKCIAEHPEKWFSYKYSKEIREMNLHAYREQKILGMYFYHLGVPYRCSTMKAVWDAIPERLDSTCRNKFRTMDDVFHQLFQMWEIFKGDFEPIGYRYYGSIFEMRPDNVQRLIDVINNEEYRMVCINDWEGITPEEFEEMKTQIRDAFEQKFPEKSAFEK